MTELSDEVIIALADALKDQLETIYSSYFGGRLKVKGEKYETQLKDDMIAVATVVHQFRPDFDIRVFYSRCGYPGTHPVHTS